ncbi:MAG: hypothetical protein JNL83_36615 [Myxococcales bacterium]|nr:hypothetical protein [Myxococcales bacterium]
MVAALLSPLFALLLALPNTKATVELPSTGPGGWIKLDRPALVAAYQGPGGALLAITRAQVPNTAAWRSRTRDAYVAEIAKGALAKLPGAKELSRKLGDANGVPALDLEARTRNGATVVLRYLLFRTYALALAIEVGTGGDVAAARAIAKSFAPPKKADP